MSILGWIVFEYVSSTKLLFAFLLFNVQFITYSILICQLFDSFDRLFVLTIFIWMFMTILSYQDFAEIYYLILSLNPHFCLLYVLRHFFLWERSMRNVNLEERLSRWSPILSKIFMEIIITIPLVWILIWYLEKLYPGMMNLFFSSSWVCFQ